MQIRYVLLGQPTKRNIFPEVIFMNVSLFIDRFIVIRFPLRASTLCTTKAAWIQIFLVYVGSVLLNIPSFFKVYYGHTMGHG